MVLMATQRVMKFSNSIDFTHCLTPYLNFRKGVVQPFGHTRMRDSRAIASLRNPSRNSTRSSSVSPCRPSAACWCNVAAYVLGRCRDISSNYYEIRGAKREVLDSFKEFRRMS